MSTKMRIVGASEAEDCDAIVCMPVTERPIMPDNRIGNCHRCYRMIQHRPNVPKRPIKLCYNCAMPDLEKEMARGGLNIVVTPKTVQELTAYFIKKAMS